MKSKYITPEITVVEFKVESGFAQSLQFDQTETGSTGLNMIDNDANATQYENIFGDGTF